MRVLLVSNQRQNVNGVGNPIMYRMRDALEKDERIDKVDFIPFENNCSSFISIRRAAKKYDLVHIHFGGVYALLIWIALIGLHVKKVITFHGTDIHAKALKTAKGFKERMKIRMNQKASFLSILVFDSCGFVASEMLGYIPKWLFASLQKKAFIQPLGVNYDTFKLIEKKKALTHLGLDSSKKYVLFSDVSNTSIKRRDIAESIVDKLGSRFCLLIMCGVKPQEVPFFINSCDFLLLTSDEEGSPNIIREALSLNKPVFSVEVGDAAKQLNGLQNSTIISRESKEASSTILSYIQKPYTDNTRDALRNILDFVRVNRKVVDNYLKLWVKRD
jgi:hypothetical protein